MKRFGVVLITLLFVGVLLIFPCFADGGSYDRIFADSSNVLPSGITVKLVYCSDDITSSNVYSGENGYLEFMLNPSSNNRVSTVRIINNSDNDYYCECNTNSSYLHYTVSSFYVPANGYFDVTSTYDDSNNVHYACAAIKFSITSDYSYSVFDAGGIIGSIGNMFGMISNSSTILLPLLLVGVSISLGLLAIRFIRKVMWGN